MTRKLSIFLGSLIFIFIFNFNNLSHSVVLNRYSLDLVKHPENSLINKQRVVEDDCHFFWFSFMDDYLNQKDYHNNLHLSSIMRCSKLHLDMLYALFPRDIEISQTVNEFYPDNKEFLYWLLNSSENNIGKSKNILDRIIELDDKDAIAWKKLGVLYFEQNDYVNAINAYTKSCLINDLQTNGCYLVGTLYRDIGQIDEAIYFFRKSFWYYAWEQADFLETFHNQMKP